MTERELEQRLRTHLHRRFDGAQPSAELVASVEQVIATRPREIGLLGIRARRRQVGWAVVLAAGLIAAVAVVGWWDGRLGPGAPTASPDASAVDGTDRQFIVLPPAGYGLDKGDATIAADVLTARLRALLFVGDSPNAFTTGVGNAITFIVPGGGPSDDSIRATLRAPGRVFFVPLPETYSNGTNRAEIGQNLPTDEPALFGREGIADASSRIDEQGRPVLTITLRPPAAEAFGAYTATHVGATFAIVVDDDVALLPTVNEPIAGGSIQVSGGGLPGSDEARTFAETAAIIVGGTLPDAWIIPIVPELMAPSGIEADLEFGFGKVEPPLPGPVDIRITSADLDAISVGPRWTAVWRLGLEGLSAGCPGPLPSDERGICRWTDPAVTHLFDAETGEWLGPAMNRPAA